MKLESSKVIVTKRQEALFSALEKVENFEKLMPDSISKFQIINENSFVFALKGMPEIALEKKTALPHSQIIFGATSGKIPFSLIINLSPTGDNQTQVQFLFEGSFNPMIAMMIKSPIEKFIETLASKLNQL
ncbi:SRPBCC family protein [Capnocytophaga sp.]|uniref:SRPBCC family protein n=1 Tax=Capnocytophaga sp. TaxID=44737 RepID=UPI0026DAB908|nr:SRPBCC family protein [Capnocytophaga sp.]MDO5105745.1 SRPBCC family protein [Capnocytophaga sp.]